MHADRPGASPRRTVEPFRPCFDVFQPEGPAINKRNRPGRHLCVGNATDKPEAPTLRSVSASAAVLDSIGCHGIRAERECRQRRGVEQMEAGRASATAERAALLRAAHQILDHPRILEDPVVLRLIGTDQEIALRRNLQAFERPELRRLRASMAVRSRFAEDSLGNAVRRGVHQYVILGAGLDSFAYRNPFPPSTLHVYEVDHPDTQSWKRQRLRDAGIEIPESLTFVPIDFERQTLTEAMACTGLDTSQPTFVSWLGVTVYLTREAVMRTLSCLSSLAPRSEIVFEYVTAPHLLTARTRSAVSSLAERAAAAGEPWLAYFEPAELAVALARLGFASVEDFGPDQAFERYCRGRTDGLRSGRAAHLIKASLPPVAVT